MSNIFDIFLVVVGISLLIFFHELGHFLAARWAGVRVDAFSIGFGPVLWRRKRGVTEYRFSLIPLGGYVKMAGELPAEGSRRAPDDLTSKSIGTRAFIFSAGILMNAALALILFPLVFWLGVPFQSPVVGQVIPGGPAWQAGLKSGDRILRINDRKVFGFEHIISNVALSSEDTVVLSVQTLEGEQKTLQVRPQDGLQNGYATLQILPGFNKDFKVEVQPGSNAEQAGLRDGDQIVAVNDQTLQYPSPNPLDKLQQQGETLHLLIRREHQELPITLTPQPAEQGKAVLGVQPPFRKLAALRENPLIRAIGLQKNDILLAIDHQPIFQAEDLANYLEPEKDHMLHLQRNHEIINQTIHIEDNQQREQLVSDLALQQDTETAQVVPAQNSAADSAGIQPGDRIVLINNQPVNNWQQIFNAIQAHSGDTFSIVAERQTPSSKKQLTFEVKKQYPLVYGFRLQPAFEIYKEPNIMEAARAGLLCSFMMVQDIWLTLKKILLQELSPKNLGGIIEIGGTAIYVSKISFTKLLFFLALLSINLAFLNVLPIPLLDGGHLFFLLIEWIKGSPVSEKVVGYSQMVGLALLLLLVVYVTLNDIQKWFLS